MLQPGLVRKIGEPLVGRQRHPVARLLQPLAQARERRDIAARTRRHDQNPHQVPSVIRPDPNPASVTGRTGFFRPTDTHSWHPGCIQDFFM